MCSAVLVVLLIDSVERARYSGYRRPETEMFGSFVSERKVVEDRSYPQRYVCFRDARLYILFLCSISRVALF